MRLKCSPDIAQAAMENVLSGIEDADIYIDDVGALADNWDHLVNLIATILRRLCENGFTINPIKCEWVVNETEWLGYWLTPRGLKPWKKKIDAILHMDRPRNATELRMFIGCVNNHRDMWPSHAHILQPLTNQCGLKKRVPNKLTDEMQKAFDKMCLLMTADALAAYPDHNKRFDVNVNPQMLTNSFRKRESPNGIFFATCPFPNGVSLYGNGDCAFCRPLSHASTTQNLGMQIWNFHELHLDSVFWFGIGWYFPSIFLTDTGRNLVGTFRYRTFGRNPFSHRVCPLFDGPSSPFKRSSRKISQNGAPAKSNRTKNSVLTIPNTNRQVCTIPRYQQNCQ
jgi:hypothetical protein